MISDFYWSSSPIPDDDYGAWGFGIDSDNITPSEGGYGRDYEGGIRCLKDSSSE